MCKSASAAKIALAFLKISCPDNYESYYRFNEHSLRICQFALMYFVCVRVCVCEDEAAVFWFPLGHVSAVDYQGPSPLASTPGLAWSPLLEPTDASLSGPSPQGACGFSSAADTNRIRNDILPGWMGLSWSNWDGCRRGWSVCAHCADTATDTDEDLWSREMQRS